MKRILAAAVVSCLFSAPAFAGKEEVDAAVKTFAAIEADAGKLDAYCKMSRAMASVDENESDEKKLEALDKEVEGYMKTLGPDFEKAWGAGDDLEPDSAEGKAYLASLDQIDGKCPKKN